jgi:hypothetical protein
LFLSQYLCEPVLAAPFTITSLPGGYGPGEKGDEITTYGGVNPSTRNPTRGQHGDRQVETSQSKQTSARPRSRPVVAASYVTYKLLAEEAARDNEDQASDEEPLLKENDIDRLSTKPSRKGEDKN